MLSQTVAAVGAPITVLVVDYGAREDDLPVSMSATVDGTADFLNTYEYDTLDQLVGVRQTGQGEHPVVDKYVTFAYTDSGALETVTRYASLDTSQLVVVSQYAYDDLGRLMSLDHFQNAAEPLAEYSWTYEGGGAAQLTSPESQAESPFGFGGGFGLDALASSSTEVSVDPLADHVWSFDTAFAGRLAQMTSADGVSDYSYDARGQLVGAIYDYQDAEAYTYDANGNRTNPGYATGDHNRLLSDGTYAYEYDAEGNRTARTNLATGQVTEYGWDHRNRLVEVVERARDHGPILQSVEYVYDSQNRWIAKSIDPDGPGREPSTDTHFVYDGNQIVLQLDDTGSVTNRNLWGPAVDQILADEQVQPDGSSETVWPLTDHLNTVRDLATYNADTSLTTIANHIIYDAFGRVTSQTDPTGASLFGFTARPFDPDTGLQNNLNRWYDAEVGRWLSEDPIGFATGDANLYRYVGNGVTMFVDPTGLRRIKIAGYVFYVHQDDLDPFPSDPHAHVDRPRSPVKVDIETGDLYRGTKRTGRNIGKKTLATLRHRLRAAGLIGLAAVIVLETPGMVEAAEEGGVNGVATHTEQLVVEGAIATGEAAVVGGVVVGGATVAGTTVTVGGAAVTTVVGATGVGAAVIVTFGVAYGAGSFVAEYTTVPAATWASGTFFDWWYEN